MENLPSLTFTLGSGVFTPSTRMSRREAREIRQQNYEFLKRLRADSVENTKITPFLFSNSLSIPQLFPSLLSIVQDVPAHIKIILATDPQTLLGRHAYIQKQMYDNMKFRSMISRIPKDGFGYSDQNNKGILDDHIAEAKKWFALEQKVRFHLRHLVQTWLFKRYKGRVLNDTDPCTLEPISNPICIFDTRARGYYQFDAKSLRRTLEFGLGFQDWMFPDPKFPKNPLTNLDFNCGQLIEIQKGIRQAGLGSWLMEGFAKCNWNAELFKLNYSVPLKLHAISSLYKNPQSEQMQEFLVEFIEDQWEAHEIPTASTKTILRWAVIHEMDDPYMQKWLDVWHEYFKLKVQYGLRDASSDRLNTEFAKTLLLLENSQKIAEFGERRLAAIRSKNKFQTPIQFPPLQLPVLSNQILTASSTIHYLTNPMHTAVFPQPAVILNPEDISEQDSEEETNEEETLVFSTPQEIASFLTFLSQLLPDGQENSETNPEL